MATIALIGSDGAGKTTIAQMIVDRALCPTKYLYMGINIESSNIALPSSRLIDLLKQKYGNNIVKQNDLQKRDKKANSYYIKCITKCRSTIRLFYRLSEEYYRQIVSWIYQLRGYLVIYDRHFVYDFDCGISKMRYFDKPISERIHLWFLNNLYPRPDLVIYLEAPPKILLSRKPESPYLYLIGRERAFNEQQKKDSKIVKICTKNSLEMTYLEVIHHIKKYFNYK